ncbi:hypothetical protein [Polyangium jinanense]|uniref:Uncharacterized protein n=1 Tax=Polyangium jinanense TaxID=2829994 RepID=A0A9X3X7X9_9BACT|nr:hypothetical protein [Polyangium jinanense]MDC3962375.1 hypothetical protein [Polyangium jinanense]MDC3985872.1 hypothetical protein [Polyangium jinanense]
MGFPHGEFVVLGTVVLAGIAGMLWLAGRAGGETPEEATSLRSSRRGDGVSPAANARGRDEDVEEPVPESGIRVKQGARVRRVDVRQGG